MLERAAGFPCAPVAGADRVNIGLRVEVHTYVGTRDGLVPLVDLLKANDAGATFLFTLGPDRSGAQLRNYLLGRLIRREADALLRSYSWRALLHGWLLPTPRLARRCAEAMRAVRAAGFEVGIHAYDRTRWLAEALAADGAWTRKEMEHAQCAFRDVFGEEANVHGAAGWRMNRNAFRLTQLLGFGYATDTRGVEPFVPVWQAELIACPQLPTSLPTLDEVMRLGNCSAEAAADVILERSADTAGGGHVYTLRVEMEGMRHLRVFERMLQTWKGRGDRLLCLADYFDELPHKNLRRHEVGIDAIAGGAQAAVQQAEFLL